MSAVAALWVAGCSIGSDALGTPITAASEPVHSSQVGGPWHIYFLFPTLALPPYYLHTTLTSSSFAVRVG